MAKKKFTAVGSYAGVGAMLIPFLQRKNWTVLGNHENRTIHKYCDEEGRNTFTENFNAPMWPDKIPEDIQSPTLIAAQPKCGGFSQLYGTSKRDGAKMGSIQKYGDMIIETMEEIARVKPEVFYMDNLAKSLLLVTPKMWSKCFPDYHLHFHWVSNYHYGNPQKTRNRLFVVGSRNGFRFVARETQPGVTVKDCIEDLGENWGCVPNHDKHSRQDEDGITNLANSNKWEDIAKYIREECHEGKNLGYLAKDGKIKTRIGSNKMYWDKHSHALAGVKGAKFHALHGFPLSIRERCRLMGYPDDFIIYGTRYMEENGEQVWSLRKNSSPVRQLNNTMPLQFCEEFATQLGFYLKTGKNQYTEREAIHGIKPNPIVEKANAKLEKRRRKGK